LASQYRTTHLCPLGERYNRPLFDPGYPITDGSLLFEEDGKIYLDYSRCCCDHAVESEISRWGQEKGMFEQIEESWIYGVELRQDFSGVVGEPKLLLRPPLTQESEQSEWERRSVASGEINRRWTEGSLIFKQGDPSFCVYHGRTAETGERRVVFIDHMEIDESGRLIVHGPTTRFD
jgi:hypothetical protein